jgi:hypothetical protein
MVSMVRAGGSPSHRKTVRSAPAARRTSVSEKLSRTAPSVPPITMSAAVSWRIDLIDPPSIACPIRMRPMDTGTPATDVKSIRGRRSLGLFTGGPTRGLSV